MSIGTPDYTRGIVSAQKQLAFLDQTSDTATVGVPPNAEALVIATPTNSLMSTPTCLGLTTALNYPAVRVGGFLGSLGATYWMFDISSALDSQVQITWPGAHLEQWWVYSDAAARLVVSPTQSSSQTGVQYVIPTVPSTVADDHPPVEIKNAFVNLTANGTVVPAPGAGLRIRLFSVAMSAQAGAVGVLAINGGNWVMALLPGGTATLTLPGQGFPLPENTSLELLAYSGSPSQLGVIVYFTTEDV